MEWLMKKFRKRKVAPSSKTDVVRDVASISGSVCSMTPSQLNDVIMEMLKLNRNRCDDACRGNPITQSGKAKQMVKMIGAILVPLFALITMTTNSFIGDLTEYQKSTSVTETLEFSAELGIFLRHLQRERDMSALYVSEISPHTKNMLVRLYSDTDDALNALTKWPITEEDHMTCDMDIFRSRDKFLTALNKHRYQLDIKRQTSKEEILYYSSLITEFIEWLYRAICQGSTGRIWKILVAFQEVIMATEYIGRERAYGVSFYALGKFKTREDYLSFLEAQDVGNMTLASSREYSDMAPDALILHRNGQEDVLHHTNVMRAEIRSNRSSAPNGSLDMAKWWFENMTIYKDTIMQCQNVLSSRLKGMIEEEANENFRKLIVTACIFGIVLIICPSIITAAYMLTSKLHQYSVSIKNRTKALNKERTRTDTLLYQMLPQALADSLRVNEHVEAKVYESSTILVGDIVGLSRVSSHCTPAEVVILLNHLHACFDQRTRAYDVHRVETIGNVYMVVSGVLAVNRRSHAPEVCTLALDLMQRIRQLEIPHISERRLLLRIGCHSGIFRKIRKKALKRNPRMKTFERRYTELGPSLIPEQRRIDYILIHSNKKSTDYTSEEQTEKRVALEQKELKRRRNVLRMRGFDISRDIIGDNVFIKLHCPFKRLCAEAELTQLEMPLKDCAHYDVKTSWLTDWIERTFETDNEVDFVSAPFLMDRIQLYEGYEDPTHFFRPAVRSLLVHHILINMDIRTKEEKKERKSRLSEAETEGLPYLLMKGVYDDTLILHEESDSQKDKEILKERFLDANVELEEDKEKNQEDKTKLSLDPRKDMDITWTIFYKFQPLWKIRNYFGEMIAFYFAWVGELTTSLWIPMLLGVAIFFYGLALRIQIEVQALLDVVKQSFDNDATPYFALIICLWGTIFIERWKRKNATLAYEWDVDKFESNEPDRPQFYGLKMKQDPVTQELNWFYPFKRQILKYAVSSTTLLFMVMLVIASATGVIVYRVIITFDVCPGMNAVECLILSSILSAVFNAVSIILLGKQIVIITENHRTQSQYDDALVIKLFAFQFVNSYASCFYIAFFRGRFEIFGYTDECLGETGTCMSQLSFQVLILMIAKPFPRFFKDIIIPLIRKLWRLRPNFCCRLKCCPCNCCHKINKVFSSESDDKREANKKLLNNYIERERLKPLVSEFTINEYTEKIIQYGFLMLFAASCPLAPLLALLLNLIDIRVDAKRLLWFCRRPVAFIRQGIGKWQGILEFVNLAGVVSNGFLIAFSSTWAQQYDTATKLWFVLGFEHIVFALKFILAYLIPDVPKEISLSIRREKYQVARIVEAGKGEEPVNYAELVPQHKKKRIPITSVYQESPLTWTTQWRKLLRLDSLISSITDCSCTFPSEIEGVWYSAHKGALTFNSTHMTGYPIYMSFAVQSLDFACYQQSDRKYLLRATETALVFGQDIRGYLCIELWRVSSTKYYYYMGTSVSFTNNDNIYGRVDAVVVDTSTACNEAEPYSTGSFIMLVKDEISATNSDNILGIIDTRNATLSEACSIPEPYNSTAFIMLVKDGEASSGSAEATCPTDLLAKFSSVSITDSTGSTSCSGSSVDVCTDRTEMNYTMASSCGSTLKFSSGNYWVCLHSLSSSGYQYLSVWNNDSTVGSTTYRFTCYVITSSGGTVYASVYPNYCSDSSQTPTSVPSPGTLHVYSGATEICYEEILGGSSGVYYATIVIGVFFLIALVILFICLYKKGCCAAMKRKCQKRPTSATSSTESSVDQGDQVTRSIFSSAAKKLKPIPGFKAKRPLRVGPIVEPSLEPLPKVEPLYAIIDPMKKRLLEAWLRSESGTSSKLGTLSEEDGAGHSGRVEVSIDINVHDYDSNLPSPRRPSNARKLRFTRSFQLQDCSAAINKEKLSSKRRKGKTFSSPRRTTDFQSSFDNKNLLSLPPPEGNEPKVENTKMVTDKDKSGAEKLSDASQLQNELMSSTGLMVAMDIVQDELEYTTPQEDSCVTLPHKPRCECKECCPHKEEPKEETPKETSMKDCRSLEEEHDALNAGNINIVDNKVELPNEETVVEESTENVTPEVESICEVVKQEESKDDTQIAEVSQEDRIEIDTKVNKEDEEEKDNERKQDEGIDNKECRKEELFPSSPEQVEKTNSDTDPPINQSEAAYSKDDKPQIASRDKTLPKKKMTPAQPERVINRNQESVIKKLWSVKASPNEKSASQKTKYSRQTYNDTPKRRETSFKKPEQEIVCQLEETNSQTKSSVKDDTITIPAEQPSCMNPHDHKEEKQNPEASVELEHESGNRTDGSKVETDSNESSSEKTLTMMGDILKDTEGQERDVETGIFK
ncbi:hypothetical protein FSP39_003125 [Pinctada imbricata]|uniref:Anoctamin n=1 Tax=Pinctada imbricata TaxID=66713 RepID=A0AA89BWS4_PINIB|nr:hypothetical protein FSP39_003125 [Pinctada imbricata]